MTENSPLVTLTFRRRGQSWSVTIDGVTDTHRPGKGWRRPATNHAVRQAVGPWMAMYDADAPTFADKAAQLRADGRADIADRLDAPGIFSALVRPAGRPRGLTRRRATRIARAHELHGTGVKVLDIATDLGVEPETVWRDLRASIDDHAGA